MDRLATSDQIISMANIIPTSELPDFDSLPTVRRLKDTGYVRFYLRSQLQRYKHILILLTLSMFHCEDSTHKYLTRWMNVTYVTYTQYIGSGPDRRDKVKRCGIPKSLKECLVYNRVELKVLDRTSIID
ncbi:hypothetical protein Btru_073991 [Bulinus truncatus]|nr:hypothetical protein Btru_073991 [Bulinus truncatus]